MGEKMKLQLLVLLLITSVLQSCYTSSQKAKLIEEGVIKGRGQAATEQYNIIQSRQIADQQNPEKRTFSTYRFPAPDQSDGIKREPHYIKLRVEE